MPVKVMFILLLWATSVAAQVDVDTLKRLEKDSADQYDFYMKAVTDLILGEEAADTSPTCLHQSLDNDYDAIQSAIETAWHRVRDKLDGPSDERRKLPAAWAIREQAHNMYRCH